MFGVIFFVCPERSLFLVCPEWSFFFVCSGWSFLYVLSDHSFWYVWGDLFCMSWVIILFCMSWVIVLFCMSWMIILFVNESFCTPVCLSNRLSLNICLLINRSVKLFANRTVILALYPFLCLSVNPSVHNLMNLVVNMWALTGLGIRSLLFVRIARFLTKKSKSLFCSFQRSDSLFSKEWLEPCLWNCVLLF